jgi:hypothetical protein
MPVADRSHHNGMNCFKRRSKWSITTSAKLLLIGWLYLLRGLRTPVSNCTYKFLKVKNHPIDCQLCKAGAWRGGTTMRTTALCTVILYRTVLLARSNVQCNTWRSIVLSGTSLNWLNWLNVDAQSHSRSAHIRMTTAHPRRGLALIQFCCLKWDRRSATTRSKVATFTVANYY